MVSKTIEKCVKRGALYCGVASTVLLMLSSPSGAITEAEAKSEVVTPKIRVETSSDVVKRLETASDVIAEVEAKSEVVKPKMRVETSSGAVKRLETTSDAVKVEPVVLEKLTPKVLEVKDVPNELRGCRSEFKAYMSYKAVTDTSSKQYKLLNGVSAHTDAISGIRMVGDRYCVALGSYYTHVVGTKVDLRLSNGTVIPCILGDCKSDKHTDRSNRYCTTNGGVAEFIVDYRVFRKVNDGSGTVNFVEGFDGKIESISIVE